MTYKIIHGEVGFDILRDEKVVRVGIATRADARMVVKHMEKRQAARIAARARMNDLVMAMREDYGLSETEIKKILEEIKS